MLSFSIHYPKFSFSSELDFKPGIHVIYGESGVGKSWLIHALAGRESETKPNFNIDVRECPTDVQVVFQNPEDQILADSIFQEIAFSFECNSSDTKWIQENVRSSASDLWKALELDRHPVTLSGGEMEQLNLVTAFSTHPKLALIDDGLSFLTQSAKQKWIEKIRYKIQSTETVVLWFTSDVSDTEFGDSKWEITLASFTRHIGTIHHPNKKRSLPKGNMDISIQDLIFSYENGTELYSGWTAHIQHCRSVGIRGENGSGKTTIARLLSHALMPISGEVKLTISDQNPSVALVDQFPERMLGISSLKTFLDQLIASGKMDAYHVATCINVLQSHHIPWESIQDKLPVELPWNILRLTMIILLANCNYDVLILDEPTFGLGTEQTRKMVDYFHEIMSRKHLVFISHDANFLASVCDGFMDVSERGNPKTEFVHT